MPRRSAYISITLLVLVAAGVLVLFPPFAPHPGKAVSTLPTHAPPTATGEALAVAPGPPVQGTAALTPILATAVVETTAAPTLPPAQISAPPSPTQLIVAVALVASATSIPTASTAGVAALPAIKPVPPTSTIVPAPRKAPTVHTQQVQPMPPPARPAPVPTLPAAAERIGGPVSVPNNHAGPRWVTLQAGHWNNQYLPEELQHLSVNTGAYAAGVSEVDVNVAVAKLAAQRLLERGYSVEVLDATVPISYSTDLFLAIHADGSSVYSVRGFKAVSPWDATPASEQFISLLYEEYGKATGLPTDAMTSPAMANYYAFDWLKYRHAVIPAVPSALLEMGFVTNPEDRKVLAGDQASLAWGIANAVDRYFHSGAAGPTPSPYPSFTPTKTPTRTPTSTPTVTPTSTSTSTPTVTPIPTDLAPFATQTAAVTTPSPTIPLTFTPRLPTSTSTPIPSPTPLAGIITADGRWLPPMAPDGRHLPPPGSAAQPVLLSDSTEDLPITADGREAEQVWQQFYVPSLGRSIWKRGELHYLRP